MTLLSQTPKTLGYRMPAEWEPHRATWLSWPKNPNSWPGIIERIPAIWVEMTRHLSLGEDVCILVDDETKKAEVHALLVQNGAWSERVHLYVVPTNDAWARDHGPIFVVREDSGKRDLLLTHWGYNAWGGKYPPWTEDVHVPEALARILNRPRVEPGIILEGGSIDVNGEGLLLTTESCLLNPNRNPHLSKSEIEGYLSDYLGIEKVLWLGDGILGDDTDGHIDDLARFVAPDTIVTVREDDPSGTNYAVLEENYKRLITMTDQRGKPLKIVTLPMPTPVIYEDQPLPASYANFYIGNRVVLVPTFDDENDRRAIETLQSLFPTRKVVGIYSRELVWGLGAFHCVTQQEPAI